ncbi:MAG: sensor histidine kinase [Aggregatilineales bacterium]
MIPDQLYCADAALHVNQTLALANTEQEVLAAFSLNLPESVKVQLLYLNWSEREDTLTARWTASYPDHGLPPSTTDCDLRTSPALLDFVTVSLIQRDPIWFAEDVSATLPMLPTSLTGVKGLVMLRLSGRAHVTQEAPYPHALLCIAWPTSHVFSIQERSFYAAVLDATAAVISNQRLRMEALDHVQQLRELDRLKTEFLGSVSHELRTPLNAIVSLSSGILAGATGESNPETCSDVELIYHAGDQLRHIISDILDYARLESGQPMALELQPLHIKDVIDEVVTLVQRIIGKKAVKVNAAIADNLPVIVADPQRVQQVLTNLLVNAVKFTEYGTVEVTTQHNERELIVCVKDTGVGIASEYHAAIFEPFRQVDRSARTGGAGLGLSICKQLITLMNGRIWVESQVGQGSRFYFSLPME